MTLLSPVMVMMMRRRRGGGRSPRTKAEGLQKVWDEHLDGD